MYEGTDRDHDISRSGHMFHLNVESKEGARDIKDKRNVPIASH